MGVETGAADARASRADDDPAEHPAPEGADEASGGTAPAAHAPAAHGPAPVAADVDRGTPLDRWWGRVLSTPRRRTLWYWGGPIVVTVLAAVLRFWNLGHPQAIVFDETYYVKDAWTLLHNGYESAWPENADADFARGDTDIFTDDPAYVVHPPLGKWMIALGMAVFGADSAFWWRASTALGGTAAVFVLALVARRLWPSTIVAVIAAFLLAIDGNAIVMSRVALLDNWIMLFALLGFWFVLLDREHAARELARRLAEARAHGRDPHYGPALWARPWVVAAGVAFGAACSVKWSGAWFLAAFGLYLVVVDALARRRAGVPFWITGAVLKQGPVTFLLMVPVALVVYLASWTGWLTTDGGYYRHWADAPENQATGWLAWVPHALQSLWHYHQSAYTYHIGVHAEHPSQANPLTWLIMFKPTNMYFSSTDDGSGGCGAATCWESIIGIGNPLIWWAAALACLYLLYRLVRYREWQVGIILLGLAAGYLPWLGYLDRTVFQFYSIAFQPYTMLALTMVLMLVLGRRDDVRWRRERGIAVVAIFLGFALLVSAFYYPIWTGMPVTPEFRQLHFWTPAWAT
ncbi:dolichyl-phosphate-mannose--protein mannosyltransferase [Agromyces mariniharenae]|uniref:Polyprenol-phosphate-mannose--protein mannosyltransferase n=1 Tax=Agromyces mariniharenae TaxID=2604423 RepID=A0A5S4UX22_9MICO|nr:phospholipid carrier-dependent glycosyltransferase [Agromyces mariniharenae]TYL50219.1 phospholipid carrier-dependent glycosyltransferase [Agromyces mariniharenae]